MSLYAGLSLRDIYKKRCAHFNVTVNKTLAGELPETPDDFHSMRTLDLSHNFLGRKGVLSIMEVVRCCKGLAVLNVSGQQIDREVVEMLCAVLRHHPSVQHLNLSYNPIDIAGGVELLRLVKENHNIVFINLDGTNIRDAMMTSIFVQVDANKQSRREMLQRAAAEQASGAVNAALTKQQLAKPAAERRSDAVDTAQILSSLRWSVHPHVFDENPLPVLGAWLRQQGSRFFDPQFPPDAAETPKGDAAGGNGTTRRRHSWHEVHRTATARYDIASWMRVSELFPTDSTLLPSAEVEEEEVEESATMMPAPPTNTELALPKMRQPGFSWIFTSLSAAVDRSRDPDGRSLLRYLVLSPEIEDGDLHASGVNAAATDIGLIAVRLFIEGAWRFVIVDDFLPVDPYGQLVFTPPVVEERKVAAGSRSKSVAVWSCIIEKALAKVYGGYDRLDTTLYGDAKGGEELSRMLIPPPCGRTMVDFTGGVAMMRPLASAATAQPNGSPEGDEVSVWETLVELLSMRAQERAAVMGRTTAIAIPRTNPSPSGTVSGGGRRAGGDRMARFGEDGEPYQVMQVCQMNGIRLVQLRCHFAQAPWQGEWSAVSSKWRHHPDLSNELRVSVVPTDAPDAPDAPFWMSYLDFVTHFKEIHICRIFAPYPMRAGMPPRSSVEEEEEEDSVWQERIVTGEWEASTHPGNWLESDNWCNNPHFQLNMHGRGHVFFEVFARDTRFAITSGGGAVSESDDHPRSSQHCAPMGFHIFQASRFPIRSLELLPQEHGLTEGNTTSGGFRDTCLFGTPYTTTDSLCFECIFEDSDEALPYWIVPSRGPIAASPGAYDAPTSMQWQRSPVSLRVLSCAPFQVSLEPLDAHWSEAVVDAEVPVSGDFMHGKGSAQLVVEVRDRLESAATACTGIHRTNVSYCSNYDVLGGSMLVKATVLTPPTPPPEALSEGTTVVVGPTPTVTLFAVEAELDHTGSPVRIMRPLDPATLIAESESVRGGPAFVELSDAMRSHGTVTVIGCLQPPGTVARVRYTVWATRPLRRAVALPPWKEKEITVQWSPSVGSGAFNEICGNPQVEVYPVNPHERLVVKMRMLPRSEEDADSCEPTITVTVVSNNNRCGEGLLGRIPSDRILAQAPYTCANAVQCEVIADEDGMDSMLIIPSLQPARSQGSCVITVASQSGQCGIRELKMESM